MKEKKVKKNHVSLYSSDNIDPDGYKLFMSQTLNYINVNVTDNELKKSYDGYIDSHQLNKKLKSLDIKDVYTTAKLCWILDQNIDLSDKDQQVIKDNIIKYESLIIKRNQVVSSPVIRKPKSEFQAIDYGLLNTLDTAIDKQQYDLNVSSLIHPLTNKITLEDTLSVLVGYEKELTLTLVDEDLREGFRCMSKQEFNTRLKFLQQTIKILKQAIASKQSYETTNPEKEVVKKAKAIKPGKPKIIKPSAINKRLEQFKFGASLEMNEHLTIKSEHPHKLLSATAVLLYNHQYRTITLLQANGVFDVHGTTINNINESESLAKRMRNPADTIQTILNSGGSNPKKIKKQIELLKTKPTRVSGRSNDQTYIIKTFK